MRNQRSRHRHALLLSARQLARIAPAKILHSDQRQRFSDTRSRPFFGKLGAHLAAETPHFGDIEMWKQRVGLEHHADIAVLRRHVRNRAVVEQNVASVGGRNPAIRFRVVVLPEPLGPSSETNEPAGTSSEMSSTAACPPKRLVKFRSWIFAPRGAWDRKRQSSRFSDEFPAHKVPKRFTGRPCLSSSAPLV